MLFQHKGFRGRTTPLLFVPCARKAAILRGYMWSAHDNDMIGVRHAAHPVAHPHPARTVGFGSVLVPCIGSRSLVAMPPSLPAAGAEAGQGVPRSPRVVLLAPCGHRLPVPARRKSGAPLAAYRTIPEGGHTTETERQPWRANALIT